MLASEGTCKKWKQTEITEFLRNPNVIQQPITSLPSGNFEPNHLLTACAASVEKHINVDMLRIRQCNKMYA